MNGQTHWIASLIDVSDPAHLRCYCISQIGFRQGCLLTVWMGKN